jgi:hypothetical protein
VAISTSGSGEGPGWVTAPGYSTAEFFEYPIIDIMLNGASDLPSGRASGAGQLLDEDEVTVM